MWHERESWETKQSLLGSSTGWTSPLSPLLFLGAALDNLALYQKQSFKNAVMRESQEVIISLITKQLSLLIK